MKNYIVRNELKCHWNFLLLPKDFLAITLFGNIFFRMKKEELMRYIDTYDGRITVNHERIHTLQAKSFKTRYLGFYVYYLYYWIEGLFKYKFVNDLAYHHIPFEIEAYKNEDNFEFSQSEWKNYI